MNTLSILLICACIICDIVFISYDNKHKDEKSIIFKSLASLMFVFLALSLYKSKKVLIVVALVFNMIGDILLIIRNKHHKQKDKLFICGTLSFFMAHIFILCYLIGETNHTSLIYAFILSVVLYMCLYIIFKRTLKVSGITKAIGCVYTYMIMFVSSVSLFNFIFDPTINNLVLMMGIVLFVSSDIILITFKFNKNDNKVMQIMYRSIYYLSQLILAIFIGL